MAKLSASAPDDVKMISYSYPYISQEYTIAVNATLWGLLRIAGGIFK